MSKKSIFNFGQKVTISYFGLFLLFFLLLFPFVPQAVSLIIRQDMYETANLVIKQAQQASSLEQVVGIIKSQQFGGRMSLLNKDGCVLFDSHFDKLREDGCKGAYATYHPEVQDALTHGYGYRVKYSVLFQEKYAYLARAFRFQGDTYVLRLSVRFASIEQLSHKFEIGFLTVATLAILLFASMTLLIISHLTKPIRTIINTLRPYQDGNIKDLPHIELKNLSERDEFFRLANTINRLSARIQEHIDSITKERDTKDSIMESLREGIISTDAAGTIFDINDAACRFLGLDEAALAGKRVDEIDQMLSNSLSHTILALQEQISASTTELVEKTLHLNEKSMLDLMAVKNRGTGGVTISIQDRTSQYQVVQLGKQFIANASHELKTPITIIQGFTETLHEHPDLEPAKLREITEKISTSCVRMDALVKSLLTLAEIENIDVADLMEECDLLAIVQNCRHTLEQLHSEATVEIEHDAGPFKVLGHASLLELTIFNFFKNAVKYCNQKPLIHVGLFVKNNHITLKISDNGIGIPKEDLDHIFERFFRVDKARSRHLGGFGLGLSIAKTILDKHQAQVLVESKLGVGTTFTVIFHK